MSQQVLVTIAPEIGRTRLLVVENRREVLKAVLGPPSHVHPRAATTLLEALSLWYQTPLSVVLCADEQGSSSSLHLCDELGLGHKSLYFDIGVAFTERRRRRSSCRALRGLGSFHDLRQLWFQGAGEP
jgi:hypothetical protein